MKQIHTLDIDLKHISLFDYNYIIKEDIIKGGLSYSLNIIKIHTLKKLNNLKNKYDKISIRYNQLEEENKILLRNSNKEDINKDLSNLKLNFTNFKSKHENIYSNDFFEAYNLTNLWQNTFNESLDNYNNVILANERSRFYSNKFN